MILYARATSIMSPAHSRLGGATIACIGREQATVYIQGMYTSHRSITYRLRKPLLDKFEVDKLGPPAYHIVLVTPGKAGQSTSLLSAPIVTHDYDTLITIPYKHCWATSLQPAESVLAAVQQHATLAQCALQKVLPTTTASPPQAIWGNLTMPSMTWIHEAERPKAYPLRLLHLTIRLGKDIRQDCVGWQIHRTRYAYQVYIYLWTCTCSTCPSLKNIDLCPDPPQCPLYTNVGATFVATSNEPGVIRLCDTIEEALKDPSIAEYITHMLGRTQA